MKWIIIIINTKEWKNEIKKIKYDEDARERDRNDKWYNKWKIWTNNNIGVLGATMISESLKTNSTLTGLYLGCDEKWSKNGTIRIV